jgi:hypothetical protein
LPQEILPKSSATFTLDFDGQVPLQIRRSGRNSEENVALSMTQWYPKMAEYDFEGWHADTYIAREFHGVWGNFDVKITIDKDYTIGSTGYLQNKNEIGKGYEDSGVVVTYPKKTSSLTWHFIAPNVHDFAWGADPEYIHDKIMGETETALLPPFVPVWLDVPPAPPLPINKNNSFGINIAGTKALNTPPEPPAPPPTNVALVDVPPPPPPPAPASCIITITQPSGLTQVPFSVKI